MNLFIVIAALFLLMFVAYRGYSVILFAPVCAMLAVLLTAPASVLPMFSEIFMEKMAGFLKLYFPVFMLGAVFGKVIELSGFSKSIVSSVSNVVNRKRAILSIVLVCAALTYGGISLFVVVFAVYPFAAEMFRQSDIPKRLIPGAIALGSFTFTMDALPGTPQIQNIIPTTFFKTDAWAAPWLGVIGSAFILACGLAYLSLRRRQAAADGEGYGAGHINEPEPFSDELLPNPWLAIAPLVLVAGLNKLIATRDSTMVWQDRHLRSCRACAHGGCVQDDRRLGGGMRAHCRHPLRDRFWLETSIQQVCGRAQSPRSRERFWPP